jgi:cell division GTPase FtsZ
MNLALSLGGAGKNTLNQILPRLLVSNITPLYINTSGELLKAIADKNRLIIDTNDISLSRSYFTSNIESELAQIFVNVKSFFMVCGLGGKCDNASPALLQFSQRSGAFSHLIIYSPLSFERDRILISEVQLRDIAPLLPNLAGYKKIAM